MQQAGSTFLNDKILRDTIDMLGELNQTELQAVQSVIRVIITKQDDYYKPLSEEQLIARIDRAIDQVNEGMAVDSEIVEDELAAEYCL